MFRSLLLALLAAITLSGCQTPLHTWEYQSKNHALYNDQVLINLDRIEQGRPRVFFIGLALWGGERWGAGDIRQIQEMTAQIYPGFKSIPFVFSNEAIMAPGNTPSFDPLMLDKSIELIRARAEPNDLLVFAVSTHGHPGKLSNKVGTVLQRPIDDAFLLQRLRRAGDINTLLLISACHSGSFVDAVQRDRFERVMVISSARADRTSFGCSPSETGTWFVQALAQAARELPGHPQPPRWSSLMNRARQIVAQWEQSRALTASMPQLWIGEKADRELLRY
jgi:Peptidase C13 family